MCVSHLHLHVAEFLHFTQMNSKRLRPKPKSHARGYRHWLRTLKLKWIPYAMSYNDAVATIGRWKHADADLGK